MKGIIGAVFELVVTTLPTVVDKLFLDFNSPKNKDDFKKQEFSVSLKNLKLGQL